VRSFLHPIFAFFRIPHMRGCGVAGRMMCRSFYGCMKFNELELTCRGGCTTFAGSRVHPPNHSAHPPTHHSTPHTTTTDGRGTPNEEAARAHPRAEGAGSDGAAAVRA